HVAGRDQPRIRPAPAAACAVRVPDGGGEHANRDDDAMNIVGRRAPSVERGVWTVGRRVVRPTPDARRPMRPGFAMLAAIWLIVAIAVVVLQFGLDAHERAQLGLEAADRGRGRAAATGA